MLNEDFFRLSGRKFDMITMWDSIEHFVDLHRLSEKIYELLSEDGYFLFSTPNSNSFEWEVAEKEHPQLSPPFHVNILNTRNVALFLKKHGFRVIDVLTPNASFDISFCKKMIEDETIDESKIGTFFKRELFDKDFESALELYLKEKRKGGNMIVVAQKISSDL